MSKNPRNDLKRPDGQPVTGTWFWKAPHLSRRVLFRHFATALSGYYLLPSRPMEAATIGAQPKGTAKNCIFILLSGAPSHTDTFDLKEGDWLNGMSGTQRVRDVLKPTSFGDIRWPQGLMPKLADQLDNIALVRSVRSWAAVHQLAQSWVMIGRNPTGSLAKIAPHIGSVVSRELATPGATMPAFVALNSGGAPTQGYFKPEHGPFFVGVGAGAPTGLANTSHPDDQAVFNRRSALLQDLDPDTDAIGLGSAPAEMANFNESARRLMYNAEVDRIFRFGTDEVTRYGSSGFGNACVTARNLLRAKNGTRFIQITMGGWDNHQNIYAPNTLPTLTRQFDDGLGALLTDLRSDGLLDETLIVALGEFGRTIGNLNAQNGRDHYLQQTAFFAGGGIKGKRAIGSTDSLGRATVETGWSRDRDVRAEDIEATIYSALGIDWTTILRDDPLGRGFEYVPFAASENLYGPVHELWG